MVLLAGQIRIGTSDGRSAFPRSWVKRKTVGAQIHSVGMQSRLNSAFLKDAGSGISLQALTHPCKRGFQGSAGLQVSTCWPLTSSIKSRSYTECFCLFLPDL